MSAMKSMEELREALLEDVIVSSPELLNSYASDATGANGAEPVTVVKPNSVEQLAGIIKWARSSKTPLVPVSSQAPHHRGDTLLEAPGAIVDMSGFQKIIMVNRRNRVALFEAGVGFERLAKEARAAGMRAMMPLLPRWGKSALTAYLETHTRLE